MATASPFPGMDPYLEQHWEDVHHRLATYSCDQLQPQLPGDLRARLQERVYLAVEGKRRRDIRPDVRVLSGVKSVAKGGTALKVKAATPLIVELDDPITESAIEIRETGPRERLITVVEFLSRTNKRGPGRKQYRMKQEEHFDSRVNLVEIDLLRGGKHTVAVPLDSLPEGFARCKVCVSRAWQPAKFEVYPLPLREPLPAIRIPLRKTDADVLLALQPLIDEAYRMGRYDSTDYRKPPRPKLAEEDAKWAEGVLRRASPRRP